MFPTRRRPFAADALGALSDDEPRRRAMGLGGSRRVREQFTLDSFLDRFERLALASGGEGRTTGHENRD